jgi:hypothetical protein
LPPYPTVPNCNLVPQRCFKISRIPADSRLPRFGSFSSHAKASFLASISKRASRVRLARRKMGDMGSLNTGLDQGNTPILLFFHGGPSHKKIRNPLPPLASSLAPENCRYHVVSNGSGSQILWLSLLSKESNPFLAHDVGVPADHNPGELYLRDGGSGQSDFVVVSQPQFEITAQSEPCKLTSGRTLWSHQREPDLA